MMQQQHSKKPDTFLGGRRAYRLPFGQSLVKHLGASLLCASKAPALL